MDLPALKAVLTSSFDATNVSASQVHRRIGQACCFDACARVSGAQDGIVRCQTLRKTGDLRSRHGIVDELDSSWLLTCTNRGFEGGPKLISCSPAHDLRRGEKVCVPLGNEGWVRYA